MTGRPRLPEAVAKATGADVKNPQRFRNRKPPKTGTLGKAPRYFTEEEREAWELFAAECPWLGAADRTLVENASRIRAEMMMGRIPTSVMTELRMILSAMGATPAARSKVMSGGDDDDDSDPADEFVN